VVPRQGETTPSRRKAKGHKRKNLKPANIPTIHPNIDTAQQDTEETIFDAFRSSPRSSKSLEDEETPVQSREAEEEEMTEEMPNDGPAHVPQIHVKVPKKRRSKKSRKRREDAEQGDDEARSEDSQSSEEAPQEDKTDGPSAEIVIPMEGEQGYPTSRGPRFLLNRAGTKTKYGSRLWGANSSFDEESPAEGVELTPLELAKIHASMRRTRQGNVVPGIFERQKTVLEAALIPPPEDDDDDGTNDVELGLMNGKEVPTEPPVPTLIPKYPLEELIPFLTLLAKTFHSYGAPVNRTEWNMREVSETLGVTANYSVMPTLITITFGLPEGMDAVSRTFRCDQNIAECGRLILVEKLIDKIRLQKYDLYQARDELNLILAKKPYYSRPMKLLAMGVSSGSSAVLFFNGGWIELGVAFVLGFMVGLLDWASEFSLAFGRVVDIIAALIVAAVAVPVSAYVPGSCFSGLVLSSLVWLLPGLTLTLSVRELATRNMVAGTVRMFSAFMTSLKLGFGIAFGSYIPFWIKKSAITTACSAPLSKWWYFPFFFTTVIPFNMLLDTHVKQWPGQLATSAVGYLISWVFSTYAKLPSELVSVLAAFGVGLAGNGYAVFSKQSGVAYIVSGILLVRNKPCQSIIDVQLLFSETLLTYYCTLHQLVPGSVGVKGATSFFDQDAWSGLQFSFTMVIIGFSITVGTLVADLLLLQKRELIHFAM
jgi:uncharacterized membrane protein YjjP (DUF1212 family)